MRVLNLYAGLGGNRKLWKGVDVTAVESDPEIAKEYQSFYPEDRVVVGDAHSFLLDNIDEYDFIWSSPPCQSHSKMARCNAKRQYPDMTLYEEILLLQYEATCPWVVENVVPFYGQLIPGQKVGRHIIWASFEIKPFNVPEFPDIMSANNELEREELMSWLGIRPSKNLYYNGNHNPAQVLRNCVHPRIGFHLFLQGTAGARA